MDVLLPPGAGYSGSFVRGPRGVADRNAVEDAGSVVVKRSFSIEGGALSPDPAGAGLEFADRIELHDDRPWITWESELATAKQHGDVFVLGGRAEALWAWVEINGTVWLKRDGQALDPGLRSDRDLQQNLFGWHPRGETSRSNDARMITDRPETPSTAATDRYDRFQNARRRPLGSVKVSRQAALPAQGKIVVFRAPADDLDARTELLNLDYNLPPLALTLFVHHGRGPDRETRWCPESQPPLVLDTIILRPALAKAHALWRGAWRWGAPGADTLRRVRVTEGAA